ncbi:hypothetical protein CEUSTIGMA_g6625.t1 [Chlamydomonas eustigma]|uniref:Uncharacterized protein n=1 Tax=Chlamydomonas eustigma TaxID=1157962 RepID=A0A250X7Y9_9CHLO|nr:hypothetical protein CEUSTIGMA_g6625.t1 [Chlamydomonas eustigma]|eukprot:GAX79185.1 hypothetical protein CEUSTIGMA_g6625.t1 [Chlamydomonas eustigma]
MTSSRVEGAEAVSSGGQISPSSSLNSRSRRSLQTTVDNSASHAGHPLAQKTTQGMTITEDQLSYYQTALGHMPSRLMTLLRSSSPALYQQAKAAAKAVAEEAASKRSGLDFVEVNKRSLAVGSAVQVLSISIGEQVGALPDTAAAEAAHTLSREAWGEEVEEQQAATSTPSDLDSSNPGALQVLGFEDQQQHVVSSFMLQTTGSFQLPTVASSYSIPAPPAHPQAAALQLLPGLQKATSPEKALEIMLASSPIAKGVLAKDSIGLEVDITHNTHIPPNFLTPSSPQLQAFRALLTSRPATGGSPTALGRFISERQLLHLSHDERAAEVRARHEELVQRKVWEAGKKERKLKEELQRAQEYEQSVEEHERKTQWSGILLLSCKMNILITQMWEDRLARPMREKRKKAAVKIASWYKRILIRRRHTEFLRLVKTLKAGIRRHLPRQKEHIRQRAALRVVNILKEMEEGVTIIATKAVQMYMNRLYQIQSWWKVMIEVRKAQRQIIYNQILSYETKLVKKNVKVQQQLQQQLLNSSGTLPQVASGAWETGFGSRSKTDRIPPDSGNSGLKMRPMSRNQSMDLGRLTSPKILMRQQQSQRFFSTSSELPDSFSMGRGMRTAASPRRNNSLNPGLLDLQHSSTLQRMSSPVSALSRTGSLSKSMRMRRAPSMLGNVLDPTPNSTPGLRMCRAPSMLGNVLDPTPNSTPGLRMCRDPSMLGNVLDPTPNSTPGLRMCRDPSMLGNVLDPTPNLTPGLRRILSPFEQIARGPTPLAKLKGGQSLGALLSSVKLPFLGVSSAGDGGGGGGQTKERGKRALRGRLHRSVDMEDPALNAKLASLHEILPAHIRHQIVSDALRQELRNFTRRIEQYRDELALYKAQMRMEALRMRLLQDAGIQAEPRFTVPTKPRMFVTLPTTKIKSLLAKGIAMYQDEFSNSAESLRKMAYLATKSRAQSAAGSQKGGSKKLGGSQPAGMRGASSPMKEALSRRAHSL